MFNQTTGCLLFLPSVAQAFVSSLRVHFHFHVLIHCVRRIFGIQHFFLDHSRPFSLCIECNDVFFSLPYLMKFVFSYAVFSCNYNEYILHCAIFPPNAFQRWTRNTCVCVCVYYDCRHALCCCTCCCFGMLLEKWKCSKDRHRSSRKQNIISSMKIVHCSLFTVYCTWRINYNVMKSISCFPFTPYFYLFHSKSMENISCTQIMAISFARYCIYCYWYYLTWFWLNFNFIVLSK